MPCSHSHPAHRRRVYGFCDDAQNDGTILNCQVNKTDPFKHWLAKVGKERLDVIENPELAMGRMQELYEKKGYSKEWIDKRLRGAGKWRGACEADETQGSYGHENTERQ